MTKPSINKPTALASLLFFVFSLIQPVITIAVEADVNAESSYLLNNPQGLSQLTDIYDSIFDAPNIVITTDESFGATSYQEYTSSINTFVSQILLPGGGVSYANIFETGMNCTASICVDVFYEGYREKDNWLRYNFHTDMANPTTPNGESARVASNDSSYAPPPDPNVTIQPGYVRPPQSTPPTQAEIAAYEAAVAQAEADARAAELAEEARLRQEIEAKIQTIQRLSTTLNTINSQNRSKATNINNTNNAISSAILGHSSAKQQLRSIEVSRESRLATLNTAIALRNLSSSAAYQAAQYASDRKTEANRAEQRRKALENEISATSNSLTSLLASLAQTDNAIGSIANTLVHSSQAIIDSLTAIENQTSSIAQEHNALARQIYTSTGVQMALDSININFDDLILEPLVPVLPELPSGVTLATDPSDPHYSDLVDAVNYYESLGQIAQTSGYQEVGLLRELGRIGIEMADDAFAAGQNLTGGQILKGAVTALDMSLDFVPGLSLLKDSISIVTGINPVTGEALSSTERAILGASFFAPAILSGTLKATVKLGKAAKKLINAGQDASGLADELVDAIRLSDEGLAKYVDTPCSPVGSFSGGASILSQGVSSSTPCPLGSVTDEFVDDFNHVGAVPDPNMPGSKGNWSSELNKPLPNSNLYVRNNLYKTDNMARTVELDVPRLELNKADRNFYQQLVSGRDDRLPNDVGGHLLASMFGGAGEGINIVAMNKQLNGNSHAFGTFGRMELKWARKLLEDSNINISINIKPIYTGNSLRPDSFEVIEVIDGIENFHFIDNIAGG